MTHIDKQISELRDKLEMLRKLKRQRTRTAAKPGNAKRGRPPIDAARLAKARAAAKTYPIPDVALVSGISLSTLYRKGIKRYRLNAEALTDGLAAA